MSRLVVVLPLTRLRPGESFPVSDWPLHITVLPPFHTDAAASVLARVIAVVIARVIAAAPSGGATLMAVAGDDALFGRRENVPVTLVQANLTLTELNRALVDAMRPFASSPDEPAFTGPGFRAHITIKNGNRVQAGDVLTLSQLALVDMAPRSAAGGRTVLATFPLPGAGPVPGSAEPVADDDEGEEQGERDRQSEGDKIQH